jgi:hypothetical protein
MSTSFKKRSRPSGQNRRVKRDESGDNEKEEEEEEPTTQIIKPQIRTIAPKTIQSTKATTVEDNNDDQATALAYSSTREIVPKKYAGDATHTIEIDTATDR